MRQVVRNMGLGRQDTIAGKWTEKNRRFECDTNMVTNNATDIFRLPISSHNKEKHHNDLSYIHNNHS